MAARNLAPRALALVTLASACSSGVPSTAEPAPGIEEGVATGIRDHLDPRNPLREWHHVFVPYCTGGRGDRGGGGLAALATAVTSRAAPVRVTGLGARGS